MCVIQRQFLNLSKMWFSVLLKGPDGNVKKEIPSSWVYSLDIVQIFKRGISRTKNHLIYYAKNKNEEPNFKLPIQNVYNETHEHGMYNAKIRDVGGKYQAFFHV